VILQYKNSKSSEIQRQALDFVICAIPFSSLRNIEIFPMFSNRKMQAIKEVFYTSSQKTLFMCRERFWEKGGKDERIFGGGSSTDLPISTIWYPSHNFSISNDQISDEDLSVLKSDNLYNNPGVLLASYNLNLDSIRLGNLPDNMRFEKIKRQIEAVHELKEGYLDSIVDEFITVDWNREKGFYGGFCYFKPGQQALFSYAMGQPEYNNKIYFAGEHISLTHGWIEGALSTGMKAANSIAEYCKRI
jgi:monoamine oxidase